MDARRLVRALVAASLALALWVAARPAMAAGAPFCDDRGATALAPPPALDADDVAIWRVRACPAGDDAFAFYAAVRRPPQARVAAFDADTASLPPPFSATAAAFRRTPAPRAGNCARARGVRSRLDRPPRP